MSITLNGYPLDSTNFPNGEVGFEVGNRSANVRWKYAGDHELLHLKMLADHIVPISQSNLVIDYLPYSRMDRVRDNWVFTLRTVCDLINSMGWGHVWVAEPHSDVCMGLLRNATAWYPTHRNFWRVMQDISFEPKKDYIIFPDAGAEKRYADMYKGFKTMVGLKKRDFQTGQIERFHLVNYEDIGAEGMMETVGRKAIIVDDLCSYGGTFMATADRVKMLGIDDITLLVAHLEQSVYEGQMLRPESPITRVYATDSIHPDPEHKGRWPGGHLKVNLYNNAWPMESK